MIGTKKEPPAGRLEGSDNRVYSETDNTEYSPDGAKSQYELAQEAESAAVEAEDWTLQDDSAGYPWLKFRTNLLDNPRFVKLSDRAKALYFELYLLAGKSDAAGLVEIADSPANIDDLAFILRRHADAVSEGLAELQAAGLVSVEAGEVTISRFTKEQGPSPEIERAKWRAKTAKKRDRISRVQARAKELRELEQNQKIQAGEVLKDKNTEKTLKELTTTKSKSVTPLSPVTLPSDEVVVFCNNVLDLWHELTGKRFKLTPAFLNMVTEWNAQGVTLPEVREVFLRNGSAADTPLYFRNVVLNHKAKAPTGPAEDYPGANKYRALREQYAGAESANNNGAK